MAVAGAGLELGPSESSRDAHQATLSIHFMTFSSQFVHTARISHHNQPLYSSSNVTRKSTYVGYLVILHAF